MPWVGCRVLTGETESAQDGVGTVVPGTLCLRRSVRSEGCFAKTRNPSVAVPILPD